MSKEPCKESGQGLVEYGLVIILVAIVIIAVVSVIGPQLGDIYSRVMATFPA